MQIGVGMFATDYAILLTNWPGKRKHAASSRYGCPSIPTSPRAGAPHGRVAVNSPGIQPYLRSIHLFDVGCCSDENVKTRHGHLPRHRARYDYLSQGSGQPGSALRWAFSLWHWRGWNAEEMEHHGTVYKTRFKKMGEQVRAMKEIWTKDVAEFHGEHVNFDPIWCWPKPAQQPHPPVLLGGESRYTLQRVVDYCEGWFPRSRQPELVTQGMNALREYAAKAGRDMRTLSVSVFGVAADPKLIGMYQDAEVSRIILRLPSEGRETILPLLDQYATFLR